MAIKIPEATQHLILDYIDALIDTGGTGYCQFETTSGVLAKIALAAPPFAAASGGAMALDTSGELTSTDCTAGTLDHLSFYSTDGTERLQFPASTTTDTGYCRVSSKTIAAGSTIEITSCTLNMDDND
jgi:hypothetical protein